MASASTLLYWQRGIILWSRNGFFKSQISCNQNLWLQFPILKRSLRCQRKYISGSGWNSILSIVVLFRCDDFMIFSTSQAMIHMLQSSKERMALLVALSALVTSLKPIVDRYSYAAGWLLTGIGIIAAAISILSVIAGWMLKWIDANAARHRQLHELWLLSQSIVYSGLIFPLELCVFLVCSLPIAYLYHYILIIVSPTKTFWLLEVFSLVCYLWSLRIAWESINHRYLIRKILQIWDPRYRHLCWMLSNGVTISRGIQVCANIYCFENPNLILRNSKKGNGQSEVVESSAAISIEAEAV